MGSPSAQISSRNGSIAGCFNMAAERSTLRAASSRNTSCEKVGTAIQESIPFFVINSSYVSYGGMRDVSWPHSSSCTALTWSSRRVCWRSRRMFLSRGELFIVHVTLFQGDDPRTPINAVHFVIWPVAGIRPSNTFFLPGHVVECTWYRALNTVSHFSPSKPDSLYQKPKSKNKQTGYIHPPILL